MYKQSTHSKYSLLPLRLFAVDVSDLLNRINKETDLALDINKETDLALEELGVSCCIACLYPIAFEVLYQRITALSYRQQHKYTP